VNAICGWVFFHEPLGASRGFFVVRSAMNTFRRIALGMRSHKLRTAFSCLCGLLALLMIALWVRSYRLWDIIYCRPTTTTAFRALSTEGTVHFRNASKSLPAMGSPPAMGWSRRTSSYKGYGSEIADASGFKKTFRGFESRLHRGGWHLPYWFLVLIAVGLAAAPWVFRWSWRFSLRTLMIVVTLSAVLMWLILYL